MGDVLRLISIVSVNYLDLIRDIFQTFTMILMPILNSIFLYKITIYCDHLLWGGSRVFQLGKTLLQLKIITLYYKGAILSFLLDEKAINLHKCNSDKARLIIHELSEKSLFFRCFLSVCRFFWTYKLYYRQVSGLKVLKAFTFVEILEQNKKLLRNCYHL